MKEGCDKSGPVPLKCHVPAHQHTADDSHGRVMLVMTAVVCQEREHGAAAARKDSARTWGTTVHTHMLRCHAHVALYLSTAAVDSPARDHMSGRQKPAELAAWGLHAQPAV
jgi:hypothetical protein